MGIVRAAASAAKYVLEEQWKEFFCCDALSSETMILRAEKRTGARSANSRRDDNVISNGSLLIVSDGQAVIVVSQGRVIDICTEPGEHFFVDPDRPGGAEGYIKDVWQRVGFGGGDIQPVTHRVYYVNMKECTGNHFQTPEPIPVRSGDSNLGLSIDLSVLCKGIYSYRVCDPGQLYRAAAGNIKEGFSRRRLNGQVHSLLLTQLQASLAELTAEGTRPSDLPGKIPVLRDLLKNRLTEQTQARYGIEIISIGIAALYILDTSMVQQLQAHAVLQDPEAAMAYLAGAAADAMLAAAANTGGEPSKIISVQSSAEENRN